MENNQEFKIVNIPFFKKIWLSITKFERYPEMATEGVRRAISYLLKLMLIFCIIIVAGMLYRFNQRLEQTVKYLNENISEIHYKDGILKVEPNNQETIKIDAEIGTLIIDTNTTEEKKIREYEKNIKKNNLGIIWLNNKVILYANGMEDSYYYEDILEGLDINEFNKADIINNLNDTNKIYISYFISMLIATYISYFVVTILDIVLLSLLGLLTSYMAKIKMRYRAIFNMSVYALTISIILKMIYILISIFTDFTIKYFYFMYTSIGYICLVASIFMIKTDVIKQQIELMKLRKEREEKIEEETKEEKNEQERKEKDEKKDDKKEKEEDDKEPTEHEGTEGSQA